jgi:phosphoribosylformimino-5-aminoimidazole carboxamide ribotide isomerase
MITIIPAIDIINGKCVRLTQGDFNTSKTYNSNPLEVAKNFEDKGFKRLHLVDLEGAKSNKIINIKTLDTIASKTKLSIDFGGGIKSLNELRKVFTSGASYATLGSFAAQKKEIVKEWIEIYSPDKFIIGIDILKNKIKINGWMETADTSLNEIIEFYLNLGIKKYMITDISKDGKLSGIDCKLYKNMKKKYNELNIIASGGVSSNLDIDKLNENQIDGIVIGKAFYENRIKYNELKKYL